MTGGSAVEIKFTGSPEYREKLRLLVIEKVFLAAIVGVPVAVGAFLVSEYQRTGDYTREYALRSVDRYQEAYSKIWKAIVDLKLAYDTMLTLPDQAERDAAGEKAVRLGNDLRAVLLENGYILGIDRVGSILQELVWDVASGLRQANGDQAKMQAVYQKFEKDWDNRIREFEKLAPIRSEV